MNEYTLVKLHRHLNISGLEIIKIGLLVASMGYTIVFIYCLIREFFPVFLNPDQLLPGYLTNWKWLGGIIIESLKKSKLCFIPCIFGFILLSVNELFKLIFVHYKKVHG